MLKVAHERRMFRNGRTALSRPSRSDSLEPVTSPWPLICPSCAAPMDLVRASEALGHPPRTDPQPQEASPRALQALSCPAGHRFDAARQGYVNLLSGRGTRFTPDSAQMIMARERVQNAGVFDALSTELAQILDQHTAARSRTDAAVPAGTTDTSGPAIFLDCGAGTGHYLHQLLDSSPASRGIALDLSVAGLKRAARHRRTLALAWDLWQPLPLASNAVDLLLDVFAPRNVAEYARVLRPGGLAVVVTPGDTHLGQLRSAGMLKVQGEKLRQLAEQMAPAFGAAKLNAQVKATVPVDAGLAADLVFMGPAGHHLDLGALRKELADAGVSHVTIDLDVSLWRR